MKLCKFGGSSLASAEQIRKVVEIILSDPQRRFVVVSAPGKRYDNDTKVTDLLIALGQAILNQQSGETELDLIQARYSEIARQLGLGEQYSQNIRQDILHRIEQHKDSRVDLMHALKAAGEDNCAKLLTDYLISLEVEAHYVNPGAQGLLLEEDARGIHVVSTAYPQLARLNQSSGLQIIPGFFGWRASDQKILTFSRGGSDITGSIFSAALGVSVYENWTDVDGVYSVNPNLFAAPNRVKELTYSEMRELSYAGFSVLHEEALEPVLRARIPLNIRNTDNPSAPGTMVLSERVDYENIVTGIAGSKGFTALHFSKYLMNREVGFVHKVLGILADLNIPFEHMPTGIDSISVILRDEVFPQEKERIVLQRLYDELGVKNVSIDRNYAIVMIVGDAMAQTVGVANRAVSALSRAGINIEFMVQGSSEISLLFGVKAPFCNYAVMELYKNFYLGGGLIS